MEMNYPLENILLHIKICISVFRSKVIRENETKKFVKNLMESKFGKKMLMRNELEVLSWMQLIWLMLREW